EVSPKGRIDAAAIVVEAAARVALVVDHRDPVQGEFASDLSDPARARLTPGAALAAGDARVVDRDRTEGGHHLTELGGIDGRAAPVDGDGAEDVVVAAVVAVLLDGSELPRWVGPGVCRGDTRRDRDGRDAQGVALVDGGAEAALASGSPGVVAHAVARI